MERETQRTGRKLTRREFVLELVEAALDEAERQAEEDSPEPEMEEQPSEGAGVSPCEAQPEGSGAQPQDKVWDGVHHTGMGAEPYRNVADPRKWRRL